MTPLLGIHHVSAIARDPERSVAFYAGTLGLRLVKQTVNFDDRSTYHFYFGDAHATPGSLMTIFPMPRARQGVPGTGQVGVTAFAITPAAVPFWSERLRTLGVAHDGPQPRTFGGHTEQVIALRDPDGLYLELVAHAGAASRPGSGGSSEIPSPLAIRGLHGVTLWLDRRERTEQMMVDTLGFRFVAEHDGVRRFEAGAGGVSTFVDLRVHADLAYGKNGAGTAHHVAFRVANAADEAAVGEALLGAGRRVTEMKDRKYFQSIYSREPGGVLFEYATDQPGLTVDETLPELGQVLQLPAHFEPLRSEIVAHLPPVAAIRTERVA
jgi:glyoxalase family protein